MNEPLGYRLDADIVKLIALTFLVLLVAPLALESAGYYWPCACAGISTILAILIFHYLLRTMDGTVCRFFARTAVLLCLCGAEFLPLVANKERPFPLPSFVQLFCPLAMIVGVFLFLVTLMFTSDEQEAGA